MIELNFASEYISNIPWDKNPAFAFSNDAASYIEAFNSVINMKPILSRKINFNNDVWDFNPYLISSNDPSNRINFSDLDNEFKDYYKFFVLYGIMGKRKISSIKNRYSYSLSVIKSILENNLDKSFNTITTSDIKVSINSRNIEYSTKYNYFESIRQFYYFMINNYHYSLPVDLKELKKISIKMKKMAIEQSEKLPNIPEDFYKSILIEAINSMRDEQEEYNTRATACMLVILTQTGFRAGDLLSLKVNQLKVKKLSRINKFSNYIHYESKKPSKAHQKLLEFDIMSSDLCTEAYNTMVKIRENCTFSKSNNYIYNLNEATNSNNKYPISRKRFNNEYKRFMISKLKDLCEKEWEGITPYKSKYLGSSKGINSNMIYIPDTQQYRVHFCTALYEVNTPLAFIQRYLGHLSEYMLGYYVRPKDSYQESIECSENVIKQIVEEDLNLLGGSFGEDVKYGIQDFINKNKFNVKDDIQSIVKAFGDKVIIRGKTGGVCIKTSLMNCSKDARTNEMFCAYDVCPNLFHFYYMIDITYNDFKVLQETVKINLDNNHLIAAQKEQNKIKDLCKRRFIPQIEELEKELLRKGKQNILEKHPSLEEVITNIEVIKKEVKKWLNKK